MAWKVEFTRNAYKQWKKLAANIQCIVDDAILSLEEEGVVPKHWDVKKIGEGKYRIRLNYRYRMKYIFRKKSSRIEIIYIGHRKDAY